LNDPTTLELYNQVLLFKNNVFEDKLLFPAPDKARQRTLQALAHKLDLECEYSVAKRTLRITRPVAEDFFDPITEYNCFIKLDLPESGGEALEDFINNDSEGAGEALQGDFSLETSRAEIDLPLYDFSDNIIPINEVHLGPWSNGPEVSFYLGGGDSQHQQSISNPLATATSGIVEFQESCILGHGTFHEHFMHGHELDETVAEGHGFLHNSKSSNELGNFVQNTAQPTSSSIAICNPEHAEAAFTTTRPSRKRKNKERSLSPACNGPHVMGLLNHVHYSAGESTSAYNMVTSSSEEERTFHREFEEVSHPSSQFQAQRYSVESTHEFTPNPGRVLDVTISPRKRAIKAPIPDYARSRSSSISSQQIELGQSVFINVFSRRPSVQGAATSPYQEMVFDSRPPYSESQASVYSNNSYASGRRGPLSELAKAGMNAVRKIGACWRCKL
jgi:hypothetical protein